jgi:segregation and condensation protein A
MDDLPRVGRDFALAEAFIEDRSIVQTPPEVDLRELLMALKDVMRRAELFSHHHIQMEPLSVRERMSMIMQALSGDSYIEFQKLFTAEEGRRGVVVSFLALMELTREKLVDLVQNEPMGQIYVRTAGDGATVTE